MASKAWKIRQENLQLILAERFNDSQKSLADALSRSESYVWQLCFGKQPRFGEKIARHIEQELQLARYSLDNPAGAEPGTAERAEWPFDFSRDRWDRLTGTQQRQIEEVVEGMVLAYESHGPRYHPQEAVMAVHEERASYRRVIDDEKPRKPYRRTVDEGESSGPAPRKKTGK